MLRGFTEMWAKLRALPRIGSSSSNAMFCGMSTNRNAFVAELDEIMIGKGDTAAREDWISTTEDLVRS